MSTSRRQKDDDVLAANGGSIEAMFADAEAELNATLNESIEDIERLNNQQPSEDLGTPAGAITPAGATTKSPAVRSAPSSSHIMDDEYEDNDNDDDGDDDVGAYSSFEDNDGDELSLDGEIENLEGLAMEDLARELRDLESMLTIMESEGDIVRQETTTRTAPFEGKGRRARARRARIKREMKAREERAKVKANDLRGGKGETYTKEEVKKPLKSLGSTSSLGRALAASQAKSSSKFDIKQGASRPSGQGVSVKKGESKTNASNKRSEPEPFQGKGRRARARRAKERREKVAEQGETAKNISIAGDAIVDEFGEEKREEAVQKMQPVQPTKREENKSVADVLKSRTFPDFSIREALS